jgi:hypothetical protein
MKHDFTLLRMSHFVSYNQFQASDRNGIIDWFNYVMYQLKDCSLEMLVGSKNIPITFLVWLEVLFSCIQPCHMYSTPITMFSSISNFEYVSLLYPLIQHAWRTMGFVQTCHMAASRLIHTFNGLTWSSLLAFYRMDLSRITWNGAEEKVVFRRI